MIHRTTFHQHAVGKHAVVALVISPTLQRKVIHGKDPLWLVWHRPWIMLSQQVILAVGRFGIPKVPRHGRLLCYRQHWHQRRMLPRHDQVGKGRAVALAPTPIHIQPVSRAWRRPASIKDARAPQRPQRHQTVPKGLNEMPLDQRLYTHITCAC